MIRRAIQEDYTELISIISGDEYDIDYLADYHPTLFKNPCFHGYVYIVKSQIVAFIAMLIVDEGSTGVLRGARVRKEFRETGILKKLQATILINHPKIRNIVAVTGQMDKVHRLINRKAAKLINLRKIDYYEGHNDKFHDVAMKITDRPEVKILNKHALMEMIRKRRYYPKIFQDSRLMIDGVPYSIMESNVPLMLSGRTSAVVSFPSSQHDTLLTFGNYFEIQTGGIVCNLDIYGNPGETLASHVSLHVKTFLKLETDLFTIGVAYNGDFSSMINQEMIGLGLEKTVKTGFKEMAIIEKIWPVASKL